MKEEWEVSILLALFSLFYILLIKNIILIKERILQMLPLLRKKPVLTYHTK